MFNKLKSDFSMEELDMMAENMLTLKRKKWRTLLLILYRHISIKYTYSLFIFNFYGKSI